MRPIIVPAGNGKSWEMEPGRTAVFRILSSETMGAVAVFEESVPSGAGTPLHIHHTSEELILVRSGTFRFRMGDESAEVGAGAWVFIPRGTEHAWRNTGQDSGDLSFVFTPAAGAVCFEALSLQDRPIPDLPPEQVMATFSAHGYELVSFDWS